MAAFERRKNELHPDHQAKALHTVKTKTRRIAIAFSIFAVVAGIPLIGSFIGCKERDDLINAAALNESSGQYQQAIDAYSKALAVNPFNLDEANRSVILCARANDYLRIKQYDKAVDDCSNAISSGQLGREPLRVVYQIRADAYKGLGKLDLSSKDFEKSRHFEKARQP